MTAHKYRPVVFVAGGEDGVCGGRGFEARPDGNRTGYNVTERGAFLFHAANLGEIRDGIQGRVNS